MRRLSIALEAGKIDGVLFDRLVNAAGKNCKALAIIIADQMRQDHHQHMLWKSEALEHKK